MKYLTYDARTNVDSSHPPLSLLGTDSLRSLTTSAYSLNLQPPGAVSWYTHGGIAYASALHVLSQCHCHFLESCVIALRRPPRDSPPAASVVVSAPQMRAYSAKPSSARLVHAGASHVPGLPFSRSRAPRHASGDDVPAEAAHDARIAVGTTRGGR
ncbi:hypothetical protein FB45DRAFT_946491, partial [Roridomyces roridus]